MAVFHVDNISFCVLLAYSLG